MNSNGPLRVDAAMVLLHADAQDYASNVNCSIAAAHNGVSPYPLSGGALFAIHADLFGMHRATLSLCKDGWAFVSVAVIRLMMDLLLSAAVITENEPEAEYRGFKYTHFFFKALLNEPGLPVKDRASMREQIEGDTSRLLPAYQERARDFMFKERLRGYWYCPEFRRPTEILDTLCPPEIRFIYDTFSAGSHGGYLGLRILKDEPNRVHPNPRPDPRSQKLALGASTRILLDTTNIRENFEDAGQHQQVYDELLSRLISLKPA